MNARTLVLGLLILGTPLAAPLAAADPPICAPYYVACFYEHGGGNNPLCIESGYGSGYNAIIAYLVLAQVVIRAAAVCAPGRLDHRHLDVLVQGPGYQVYLLWAGYQPSGPSSPTSCTTYVSITILTPVTERSLGCPVGPPPNPGWGHLVP